MPEISLETLAEVFVSNATLTRSVSRWVAAGRVRKLASKVYTRNLRDSPETIVRRNLWTLIADLVPGGVITDRTALENAPAADGSIFLIAAKKEPISLPGVTIRPRPGVPALSSDRDFIGGLKLASPARACLENIRSSRSRGGSSARTFSRTEMEDYLETILQRHGEKGLNQLRDEARSIAPKLLL